MFRRAEQVGASLDSGQAARSDTSPPTFNDSGRFGANKRYGVPNLPMGSAMDEARDGIAVLSILSPEP